MGVPVTGVQGEGLASVWKTNTNDFWRFAAIAGQKQAQAQKTLDDERKMRDKLIEDNLKFTPEKTWEPFYGEVADLTNNYLRQGTKDLLEKGRPHSEVNMFRGQAQGEINKAAAKSRQFEDIFKDLHTTRKEGEKSGVYKPGYFAPNINDVFFNGRQAKGLDAIDTDGTENIFNDSRGYNMENIGHQFVKNLPQQLIEKYRKINSDLGLEFDVTIAKSKLGLALDQSGNPVLDPRTGLPKVGMTDDVTLLALENPYIRNFVIDNLGPDAIKTGSNLEKVKDLLAPIITPYDQRSMQTQHRQGFKYAAGDVHGGGYTVPLPKIEERYDTVYRITHEHDPELLAALIPNIKDNVNIGYEIYGPGESKKAPPRIKVTFPNKQFNKDLDKSADRFTSKTLSLETEEDRQAAMEVLSEVMDSKLDAKERIGENFTNYRKKVRKKEKDAGGPYEGSGQAKTDTGGVY